MLSVHETLEPEKEAFALYVSDLGEAAHSLPDGIVAMLEEAHDAIEAEGAEEGHGNDYIELHIDASTEAVGEVPYQDVQEIEQKDATGGSYM